MNTPPASDAPSLNNTFKANDTEQEKKKGSLTDANSLEVMNVLHPDDSLMKKFQDALRDHLVRIGNKLSSEIADLEAAIRSAEKEREEMCLQLYYVQQDVAQQKAAIEKYQGMIASVISLREEKDARVKKAREVHKTAHVKLADERRKEEGLRRELEQFAALQAQFAELRRELESGLAISKRVTEKDRAVQRDLIAQKEQKDFIIFRLMEEVWEIKTEIAKLDAQLQLKNQEKIEIGQMIADVNADLEALHKQHKDLCAAWKSVVLNITRRNNVYEQLNTEREKICESFTTLHTEIEKVKKETDKETENNEHLTSLHMRIQDNVQTNARLLEVDSDKLAHLQSELVKLTRFSEQKQRELDVAQDEWQNLLSVEDEVSKEVTKLLNKQNELENIIYSKLEEKVTHDKAARYLNKLLSNSKEKMQERELALVETENSYGKKLLELEQSKTCVSQERAELDELVQSNVAKEKEIDEIQREIKTHDTLIDRKRDKVVRLNKSIEEILSQRGGEEISPLDAKIKSLEKTIEETQQSNQRAQQLWLRQEGHMITLSQQRDSQLQELNLLNKEVLIMEQKNLKLEHALEVLDKEESNMERVLNLLQQKLVQINAQLAAQKGLKQELEGKTSITKTEGVQSLEDAELNLIKMQNDLRQLHEEKAYLRNKLDAMQQESLSWEKKLQLMQETVKKVKDERSSGDIAMMKTEIHKMEMRLSHLRRVQEKLIHDMEFCVTRRDMILDRATSKLKKDPKGQHNQKVIFCKRLADQRLKIRQIIKETKKIEYRLPELERQVKDALDKCNESRATLKAIEDDLPNVDQEIVQTEANKYHNLQALVFKQRKVKMLQDIKSGRYRMLFKSETSLNEEFQNEQILRDYLKYVMERTCQDFPLLKDNIHKILLTLEIL